MIEVPVFTPVQNRGDFWNHLIALEIVKTKLLKTKSTNKKNEEIEDFKDKIWVQLLAILNSFEHDGKQRIDHCFAGLVSYFIKLKVLDNFIMTTSFTKTKEDELRTRMKLDGFVLNHLELISSSSTKKQDNLFAFMDRCFSAPGKRMLRSQICSPSLNISEINSRLDAIEVVFKHPEFIENFRILLEGQGDYERRLIRLTSYSLKKSTAVFYHDMTKKRLLELKNFFKFMEDCFQLLKRFSEENQIASSKLTGLVTPLSVEGGLMPEIASEVQSIMENIEWTEDGMTPLPKLGLNPVFDDCKVRSDQYCDDLETHLEQIRDELNNDEIKYANIKDRYEIEIPDKVAKSNKKNLIPKDFVFSSSRKGYTRYTSEVTRRKVEQIKRVEDEIREELSTFCAHIFEYFLQRKHSWTRFIDIIKELDVLVCLSSISFATNMNMTRPTITTRAETAKPAYDAINLVHPVLVDKVDFFVPNDVTMGTKSISPFLLITGPNMGGKSTMLRQVAISVIMGQIGCYVAAESCSFTLVDRIFTRLGATERIIIGKSTFQVEAEEAL